METPSINPGAYSDLPAAIGGQFFDEQPRQVDARVNGDSVSFPFGVAVVHQAGDSDTLVRLPTPTNFTGMIEGITGFTSKVSTLSYPYYTAPDGTLVSGNGPLVPKMSLDVLRKGRIWVLVENAVSKGGAVYTRVAADTNGSQLGAFRADASVVTGVASAMFVRGAIFDTSASAGGLAALRFDFDAQNAVEQAEAVDVITKDFTIQLASIPAPSGTVAAFTPGIAGEILSLDAEVEVAGTGTGTPSATLVVQIGLIAVAGTNINLLTSNAAGTEVSGAATGASGSNLFKPTDQLKIVASGVSAFSTGQATLTISYRPYP